MATYLELLFPSLVAPGDLEIITPASHDQPGRGRLLAAKRHPVTIGSQRIYSANGQKFIGYISDDQPLRPFDQTYWLEEDNSE